MNAALKGVRGFKGVYLRDQIRPIIVKKGNCAIINLDDSDPAGNAARGGTHWVCFYDTCYFDSFGGPPPDRIAPRITAYSSTVLQDPADVTCGYWCIYFIRLMSKFGGDVQRVLGAMADMTAGDLVGTV